MSISPELILSLISEETQISIEEIKGTHRLREKVEARMLVGYYVRIHCPMMTFKKIGELIGRKDHSTIIHYIKVVEALYDTDEYWKDKIDRITGRISLYKRPTVPVMNWETDTTIK